jgi:hypothetical protein
MSIRLVPNQTNPFYLEAYVAVVMRPLELLYPLLHDLLRQQRHRHLQRPGGGEGEMQNVMRTEPQQLNNVSFG